MRDLLAELTQALEGGRALVFCSVVETRGSTPQKAGAAMLVFPDGSQAGTLGGGCVEAEVKRRALYVLNEPAGSAEILSFCLDDDYGWDDGLICGGRMTMLVAPIAAVPCGVADHAYYRRYRVLVESGTGCTEIVALPNNPAGLPAGARFLFDANGSPAAELAAGATPAAALVGLRPLAERPRPSVQKGFAYLPVLPRITLFVVGGGHVGQAVAQLAATVDFNVWALDDREKYVGPERFPAAQRRLVGDIGRTLRELAPAIHPGMYCLIVTRGHNHDEEALYHLARTRAGYVGMIGSKRKIKMIFDDLAAKGVSEEALARVHAPLGLPIGSQTVAEIAVSIVAELIARREFGAPGRGKAAGGGRAVSATFALLPAAGQSTRMGRPKLSLPLGQRTVIEVVIGTLREAGVRNILVVAGAHGTDLIPLATAAGARALLLDTPTEDMRGTVQAGLNWIEANWRPTERAAFLLVPADHPLLCANVVKELFSIGRASAPANGGRGDILVPTCNGRRGHPTLIGWGHVAGIRALPGHLGLNAYLRQHPEAVREVPVSSETILLDLDTPEDYEAIKAIVEDE